MVSNDEDRTVDPAREGLEHLQSAAREMIAAARSMLDAVDELLDDPRAASSLATAVSTVGRLVEGAVASLTSSSAPESDEPRVQRVKVS